MKFEFPDTGEGINEGKFLQWLVEEGEKVEEDQAVAEAETDKAVIEVPAPADGTVESLKASPGDVVEVGEVIMELETGSESTEEPDERAEEDRESTEDSQTNEAEVESDQVLALPKVRKLAAEKNVDLDQMEKEGRLTEEDVLSAADSEEEETQTSSGSETVQARPSVRKLAREKEVDIEKIEGTGRGGEVTRSDVLEAAESPEGTEETEEPDRSGRPDKEVERKQMSNVRQTTAERMAESRFTAPHVTHVEKVDLTELAEMRKKINEETEQHLTYLPFVAKAAAEALKNHPDLNAELDEESDEIIRYRSFDFNIAVDTDRGLLTPLLEEVGEMSIAEIGDAIEELAKKAQEGDLSREQLENGTFSITNLGAIGGEEFTPIINYPQAAILGIGRIGETAEVVDGEIEARTTVKLSLSYDHRIIDGADGARFMNELKENLESPERLMVNL